ncbi:MAG: hypothetical protein KDN20_24065 [Verrucomicrobiae bacterium]|nr:hypothetical protein [Verrucomicrobiae bacterium]
MDLEAELKEAYGSKEYETNRVLYEFGGLKDDSHQEKFQNLDALEFALRRFIQQRETVSEIRDQGARQLLMRLADKNLDDASDPDFCTSEENERLQQTLLWEWWGPSDYVRAYLQARPLIAVCELPSRLQELVGEARRCYAFGQMNAVMALGRMILEFAITDIGVRTGRFPAPESLDDYYRAYPPFTRADKLLGNTGPRRTQFRKLYDTGSKSIHSSSQEPGESPIRFLREVLDFVSNEYAIGIREPKESIG